jgi:hypothetical protein
VGRLPKLTLQVTATDVCIQVFAYKEASVGRHSSLDRAAREVGEAMPAALDD